MQQRATKQPVIDEATRPAQTPAQMRAIIERLPTDQQLVEAGLHHVIEQAQRVIDEHPPKVWAFGWEQPPQAVMAHLAKAGAENALAAKGPWEAAAGAMLAVEQFYQLVLDGVPPDLFKISQMPQTVRFQERWLFVKSPQRRAIVKLFATNDQVTIDMLQQVVDGKGVDAIHKAVCTLNRFLVDRGCAKISFSKKAHAYQIR